jgi:hypothetical protein
MNRSTALFLNLRNAHGISIQSLASGSSPCANARSLASQPPQQPQSDASVVKEASGTAQATTPKPSSDTWTEVVHPESGKTYFWNQKTGETTELGAPKPADDQGHGGSSGSGHQETETANDRSEASLPDRTGFYAATGALVGAVLGWGSQFF